MIPDTEAPVEDAPTATLLRGFRLGINPTKTGGWYDEVANRLIDQTDCGLELNPRAARRRAARAAAHQDGRAARKEAARARRAARKASKP